jgi:hypothetical protein
VVDCERVAVIDREIKEIWEDRSTAAEGGCA